MSKKYEYIYMITNLFTGKSYIGKHHGTINDGYMGSGKKLRDAYKKWTKDAFSKIILEMCTSDNVFDRERHWISIYKTNIYGYNITPGGESGPSLPGELNPMYGLKGPNHPKFGHTMSKAGRLSVSKTQTGKKLSHELIAKLKQPRSIETKLKIKEGINRVGGNVKEKNGNYNKGKPVLQYSLDGILLKEWPNSYQASQVVTVSNSALYGCLTGKSKTSGGFIWKYKTE